MAGSILGTRVVRTEDPGLLLGEARYVDDLSAPGGPLEGALHLVFVRSEMAHARIAGIDTTTAAEMPGVVTVLTAADLGLRPSHGMAKVHDHFARPALADDKVRFVGEAIVAVIAETAVQAKDAADTVIVDYEPLGAVVHPEDAFAPDAPVIFDVHGDNLAMSTTDTAQPGIFDGADVVVRGRYVNQRMAVVPMEPHGAAAYVGDDGRVVVYGSTQMPHLLQGLLARSLGVTPPDVGSCMV